MGYIYINQKQKDNFVPKKEKITLGKKQKKMLSIPLFTVGILLLAIAVAPIVRYQFFESSFRQVLSPVSPSFYNRAQRVLGDNTTDYTQLSNWFNQPDKDTTNGVLDAPVKGSYLLSIPKLKIEDANVSIGGQDLAHSLIHYVQTALPGQVGSPVIFGHSVLPQFFNTKNYTTIFSTVHRLKLGDEVLLNYDGVKYKYLVDDMYETEATDLSVLEQRFDGKYLTIVTCHPPGTYLRRLVIKARIVDY